MRKLWALPVCLALAACASDPEAAPGGDRPGGEVPPGGAGAAQAAVVLGDRPVLVTSGAGTAAFEAGAKLAREGIAPSSHVAVQTDVQALYAVVLGQAELAIVQADVWQAPEHEAARAATVAGKLEARATIRLANPAQGVAELIDLQGAQVAAGREGSGTRQTARAILAAAGLEPDVNVTLVEGPGGAAAPRLTFAGGGGGQGLRLRAEETARLVEANPAYQVEQDGAAVSVALVIVARRDLAGDTKLSSGEEPPTPLAGAPMRLRQAGAALRLAAGPDLGTYAAAGAGIGRAAGAEGGLPAVEALATAGSLENLALVASGLADLAIVQEDLIHECLRARPTSPLLARVRLVAPLFHEEVHLVRAPDAKVGRVADLRGLRVGLGEVGSGTLLTAQRLLRAARLGPGDLRGHAVSTADAARGLGRDLDAAFAVGGQPLAALRGLPGDAFVGVPSLAPYTDTLLVGESYPGLPEDGVPSIATRALLVARVDLEPAVAEVLVRALFRNRKNLAQGLPKWGELDPASLEQAIPGLELHDGAKAAVAAGIEVDEAPAW